MKIRSRLLILTSSIFLLLWLNACGVETGSDSSNGGAGTQLYEGTFVNQSGAPISGVTALILESGASCVSGLDGLCQIEGSALAGQITVELNAPGQSTASITFYDVPADASLINYTVVLSASGFALIAFNTDRGVPNPDSTPTPAATLVPGQPTPRGTATPKAGPTAIPDPKAEAIKRGKRVYQNICGSCHGNGKAAGYSASQVSAAMALPQHSRVSLGSQLNDLVAYLNR